MSSICRLCLQKEKSIVKDNIFDLHLTDTFYWMYGVEVDVDDPYSKLICRRCQNITNYIIRVRKQYQTNQYILKEKKCPQDYDVDLDCITKDVGTSTEKIDTVNKIIISHDTLIELSRPFVKVRKLEETDIHKEYQRISKYSFRKRRRFQTNKGRGPDRACSIRNICNSLSSSKEPKISKVAATNTNSQGLPSVEARSRPVLISRATNTSNKNIAATNTTSENSTLLSKNILQQFFSPVINVQRLEETNLSGQYERVDGTTYRLIPPQLELQTEVDQDDTKRLSYMDYYYKIPTSALKELIIERHNELSSDQNSIAINNCKEKEVSPFETNSAPHLEVCKQCKQVFKTKDMLNIHCHLRHKPKPKSKPGKRKARFSFGKPKGFYSKAPKVEPQTKSGDSTWSQPRKITELFSSLEQAKFSQKQLWLNETHTKNNKISPEEQTGTREKNPLRLVRRSVRVENLGGGSALAEEKGRSSCLRNLLLNDDKSSSAAVGPSGSSQVHLTKQGAKHSISTPQPRSLAQESAIPIIAKAKRKTPVAAPSSSNVQPEFVWFPETMVDLRDVESEGDPEPSDSCLETTGVYMNNGAKLVVTQTLCDLEKTRAELESMKNIRTALQKEIETATFVDKKYDFIMDLLAQ